MTRIEFRRSTKGDPDRDRSAGGHWCTPSAMGAHLVLSPCVRWLWFAAVAILGSGLSAGPVSAQDSPASNRRTIQGGPFVGMTGPKVASPEPGFRLGVKSGTRVWDLSASTYVFSYPIRPRSFEVLAGFAWQPNLFSIGVRSGLMVGRNGFGERHSAMVLGPNTGLTVPLGSAFHLRGEAGALLYMSPRNGPGGPRGYLRIGIEAGRR